MKSLSIELPFPCPYDNAMFVTATPVFPPPPPWGRWLFGPNQTSFQSLVSDKVLTPNGEIGSFTANTYTPGPRPRALVSTLADSQQQTLIFAIKKPVNGAATVGGSLVFQAGGSGILFTGTNGLQFVRRGPSSTYATSVNAAIISAISDPFIVVAIVDTQEKTSGFIYSVDNKYEAVGPKVLTDPISVGNFNYGSSSALNSVETYGAEFYNRVLADSEVRQKMKQLRDDILAR